jgi:hypothetical protein
MQSIMTSEVPFGFFYITVFFSINTRKGLELEVLKTKRKMETKDTEIPFPFAWKIKA